MHSETSTAPHTDVPRLQAERDLVIDLVRVGSIAAVVIGHWLVAGVEATPEGLATVNALGPIPALRPLTWAFQVMPLFFVAGGAANHASWTSARRRGTSPADWMAGRLARLIRPTVALAVVWAVAVLGWTLTGGDRVVIQQAAWVAGIPLWFLAAYVPTVMLAPYLARLGGSSPVGVVAGLAVLVVLVDLVGIGLGIGAVRFINVLAPWLFFQQLGFWWREGRLPTGRPAALWAGLFLAATIAATWLGPYAVSMVSVPGEALGNTTPPTVALVMLGCTHLFAVRSLARPLERMARRRSVRTTLLVVGSAAMTVYLWHFTALILVAAVVAVLGAPLAPVGALGWWVAKPLWMLAAGGLLAGMIRLLRGYEAPWRHLPAASSGRVAITSALTVAAAVRMTTAGFSSDSFPLGVDLLGPGLLLGAVLLIRMPSAPGLVRA